jgi:DNA polymerase-1
MTDTIIYDEEAVKERYELKPEQLIDFKGLKGDPSDNIPGVPGVGEKTAISILKQFGTIENLYKELEKGKTKDMLETLKKRLLDNKEQAIFSKRLATIRYDVPMKFNLEDCRLETYSHKKVVEFFEKLEFNSLISRLPNRQLVL